MRYQRFENSMLQLAEYLRKSDPVQADLLVRAIGRSKETRIPDQMQQLAQLLKQDQLGDAVEQQEVLLGQLKALLELLQSEDRQDELEREKRRLEELVKNVDKLISREKDVRAATERNRLGKDVEQEQQKVGEATDKLLEKIGAQDAERNADKDQKNRPSSPGKPSPSKDGQKPKDPSESPSPGDPRPSDSDDKPPGSEEQGPPKPDQPGSQPSDPKKPGEKKPDGKTPPPGEKPSDGQAPKPPEEGEPQESPPGEDGKPSESSPSEPKPGKPKPGKPAPGQKSPPQPGESQDQPSEESPSESQPQELQEQDPLESRQTGGKAEIQKAREKMERAIEELKKQNKEGASDEQDAAIAELMKAKERLEEILRQLREEEKTLVLTALEARFRDMLSRQQAVYNGTLGVAQVPEAQRNERHTNRAVELGRTENEIVLLADKTLTLLKEEGSSVAFPEAIEQLRDDMQSVARRLEQADVGELTQGMERDILETLEELIAALQQELEKRKDQKQQQQQQQQQSQQENGLVNNLAELKMLRSLQFRINRRTRQLGRLVDGEQATEQEVVEELQKLSLRQSRIQEATHSIATGKTE